MKKNIAKYLVESAKEYVESMNNIAVDGFKYRYSMDTIIKYATDERAYEFIKKRGIKDQEARMIYNNLRLNGVMQFNFHRVEQRLELYRQIFNGLREMEGKSIIDLPVYLIHSSWMNAEIKRSKNELEAVLIHSGIGNFQLFCMFFQIWMQQIQKTSESNKANKEIFGLPTWEEYVRTDLVDQLRRLLRRQALECHGDYSLSKDMYAITRSFEDTFWYDNEELLKRNAEYVNREINWDTTEAFLLCHEYAHIILDHFSEIDDWYKNPTTDEKELVRRKTRRREMEYEADKFALPYAIGIQDFVYKKSLKIPGGTPIDNNEFNKNILKPMQILFLIFYFNEEKPLLDKEYFDYYPNSLDRFKRLFEDLELEKPVEFILKISSLLNLKAEVKFFCK